MEQLTPHMRVEVLQDFLGDRVISCGLWPARYPHLTFRDLCLLESLKGEVEDETNIRRVILAIPWEEPERVNFFCRYTGCVR